MTKEMNKFIKMVEAANEGRDVGLELLKSSVFSSKGIETKRYGDAYIAYTQIDKLGTLDISRIWKSEICINKKCDSLSYIERVKIERLKEYDDKSILSEKFEICIVHNLKCLVSKSEGIGVFIEDSIDIFIVTRYGCFDVFKNINTNIPIEYAIKEMFKKSSIVLYTSSDSEFEHVLNEKINMIMNSQYEEITKNADFKFSIDYTILKSYISYDSKINVVSAFVDEKYFHDLNLPNVVDVEVTLKNNYTDDISYKTTMSVFGLGVKVSSEYFAKLFSTQNLNVVTKGNISGISSLRGIKQFRIEGEQIEELKNLYYEEFINVNYLCHDFYSLRRKLIRMLYSNVTFEEINLDTQKVFLQKNNTYENDEYIVEGYTKDVWEKGNIYRRRELLVESKENHIVFLLSTFEVAVCAKISDSLMYLPIVYFVPRDIFFGSHYSTIEKTIGNHTDKVIHPNIYRKVYEIAIKEFGDIELEIITSVRETFLNGKKLMMDVINNKEVDVKIYDIDNKEDKSYYIKFGEELIFDFWKILKRINSKLIKCGDKYFIKTYKDNEIRSIYIKYILEKYSLETSLNIKDNIADFLVNN